MYTGDNACTAYHESQDQKGYAKLTVLAEYDPCKQRAENGVVAGETIVG